MLPHPKVLTKMAKSGSVNLAGSELVRNLKEIKKVLSATIEPQYIEIDMAKSASLPLAHDDVAWNEGSARKALKKWATKPDGTIDTAKYARAFLYDPGTGKISDMKLPIGTISNGVLFAVPNAIRAAKQRFNQTQGLSAEDKARIAGQLNAYSKKLGWPTDAGSSDQKTTTQPMSKSLTNNDHQFELFRADEPEKRNLVYGIAYVPNRLDSQRQWAPPEVLKEAAHWHMENSQLADTEHQKLADARLVESSILDTDQEFGGRHIPTGSWKIAHSVSDDLKKDFDDGKYVGHSMFGRVEGYYGEAPPGYMAKSGDDVDSIFKITKIRAATMGFVSTVANELPVVVTECEGDCPLA